MVWFFEIHAQIAAERVLRHSLSLSFSLSLYLSHCVCVYVCVLSRSGESEGVGLGFGVWVSGMVRICEEDGRCANLQTGRDDGI